MKGFIIKYAGKEFRAAFPDRMVNVIADININDRVFGLSAGNRNEFVNVTRMAKDGIELEIEVAEFDKMSETITPENRQVDPEYQQLLAEQQTTEWYWKEKLKVFRRTEVVLKEEGLI